MASADPAPPAAPPRPIVTTSWDDGHPLDLRLADLLEKHGVPGTFYVPRRNPLNDLPVLGETDIRGLADRGFEIGGHTLDHAVLTELTAEEARQQIEDSRRWVEDVTGKPCAMFCPPCGKFSAEHVEMIRDAGYAGFRTVELWSVDPPRDRGELVELPTTIQAQPPHAVGVMRNLIKRWALPNLWHYVRRGRDAKWSAHARTMLDLALDSGGVFHLWGHSWELEDEGQWDRLDAVLAVLSAARDRADLLTNGAVGAARAAATTS